MKTAATLGAVAFITLATACTSNTQDRTSTVVYSKDHRTGFCFASKHLGSSVGVMTWVPCTSEVERLAGVPQQ